MAKCVPYRGIRQAETCGLVVDRSPAVASTSEGHHFLRVGDACRPVPRHEMLRLVAEADERLHLTQRERITLGALAQSGGMTARELAALLETEGAEGFVPWLGRLVDLGLVQSAGRTRGTRYFVAPGLLHDSGITLPTTVRRIEPHRLLELVREDLRRYPRSRIGDIGRRVGTEVNRSQLKRALAELVRCGVVAMEGRRSGARYETLINETLKASLHQADIEATLRRVIREELADKRAA